MSIASSRSPRHLQRSQTTCTKLPHGFYALLPSILSLAGWLISLAEDGCEYAIVTGPIVEELTADPDVPYLEFGFNGYRKPRRMDYYILNGTLNENEYEWHVDSTSRCSDYDSTLVPKDAYWEISKVFAFVSIVLGGGGALFLSFSSCFVFSPATWKWAGYEILLASLFQGGSFLWFATSVCTDDPANECRLLFGSQSDIVSATLWFMSALLVLFHYPQSRSGHRSRRNCCCCKSNRQKRLRDSLPVVVIHNDGEEDRENEENENLEMPLDGDRVGKISTSKHDVDTPTDIDRDLEIT